MSGTATTTKRAENTVLHEKPIVDSEPQCSLHVEKSAAWYGYGHNFFGKEDARKGRRRGTARTDHSLFIVPSSTDPRSSREVPGGTETRCECPHVHLIYKITFLGIRAKFLFSDLVSTKKHKNKSEEVFLNLNEC